MKTLLTGAGIILLITLTGNGSSAVKKVEPDAGPFANADSTIQKMEATCDRFIAKNERP